MKIVLFMVLILFSLEANDIKHITLGAKDLTLIEEDYNLYGARGTSVSFYIEEKSGDLRFLKTFTTKYKSGDCMNKELESGVYKIDGKNITFYTLKSIKKKADKVPYYAEISRYSLENGKFKLVDKKIYSKSSKNYKVLGKVQDFIAKSEKTTLSPWKR